MRQQMQMQGGMTLLQSHPSLHHAAAGDEAADADAGRDDSAAAATATDDAAATAAAAAGEHKDAAETCHVPARAETATAAAAATTWPATAGWDDDAEGRSDAEDARTPHAPCSTTRLYQRSLPWPISLLPSSASPGPLPSPHLCPV